MFSSVNEVQWISVRMKKPDQHEIDVYYANPNVGNAIYWCQRKFGLQSTNLVLNGGWFYHGRGEFRFQREVDAIIFSLRWL